MTEPEFPLCSPDDPRVPVVLNMLRKSLHMGGNFTLDARRILAALDRADSNAPAPSPVSAATGETGGATEAQEARE